jgi:ribose transport system permease protein
MSDTLATGRRHQVGRAIERYGIIGVVVIMMIALYALQPEVRILGAGQIPIPGLGEYGVIPASALVLLVVYTGIAFFLNKASVGRHIYAVGGNPQAARVSGISVERILLLVYTLCGFFAGLALLLAGRTDSGFPNAGIGAELDAIAAVIIGGASFFGGRGTVLGVFAGVLIMGLLHNQRRRVIFGKRTGEMGLT